MTDDSNNGEFSKKSMATQFKPGQSGNPKGRPKGSKNRATIVDAEINAAITVTENGQRQKVTKWQAAFKQQMNKAVGGDREAFKIVQDTIDRVRPAPSSALPSAAQRPVQEDSLTAEDAARIYLEEVKKGEEP